MDDPVKVETYVMTFQGENPSEDAVELKETEFKFRVQLYFSESDPSNILGAGLSTIYTANTKSVSGVVAASPQKVSILADDTIEILHGEGTPLFTGFKRHDSDGETGSATMVHGHQNEHELTLSYTRTGVAEVKDH